MYSDACLSDANTSPRYHELEPSVPQPGAIQLPESFEQLAAEIDESSQPKSPDTFIRLCASPVGDIDSLCAMLEFPSSRSASRLCEPINSDEGPTAQNEGDQVNGQTQVAVEATVITSQNISCLMQNPETGEVIAVVSAPTPSKAPSEDTNRAILPGLTMDESEIGFTQPVNYLVVSENHDSGDGTVWAGTADTTRLSGSSRKTVEEISSRFQASPLEVPRGGKKSPMRTCVVCEAELRTGSMYRDHVLGHTLEHEYRCDYCVFSAHSASTLAKHVRFHKRRGDNPLPEDDVAALAKFVHSVVVSVMTRDFPEVPRYKCSKCPLVTYSTRRLRSHLVTHDRQTTQLTCHVCGTHFRVKVDYVQHIRLKHKPVCYKTCPREGCKFRYRRKADLKRHKMLVHDNKSPHPCEKCKFAATSSGFLARHRLKVIITHWYTD